MAEVFALLFLAGLITGVAWVLFTVFGVWGIVFGIVLVIIMGAVRG